MFTVVILLLGVIKVGKWGGVPLAYRLGGDFDHGKIMGLVYALS